MSQNATFLQAAIKLTANIMGNSLQNTTIWTGGNDGWPAWTASDVYVKFRDIFDQDPTLFNVTFPLSNLIKENVTNPLNVSTMFRLAMVYSLYSPVDSTSNHMATNGAGRFLAEYAFPGQVVFKYNDATFGVFGEKFMRYIAGNIPKNGFGEYGSPNYGPYNFVVLASVATIPDVSRLASLQGSTVNLTTLPGLAAQGYRAGVLQLAAFWFKGDWAMACGRGYPITGAWGPVAATLVAWIYHGGDFPHSPTLPYFHFIGNYKGTQFVTVLAHWSGLTVPVESMMIGASTLPKTVKASFSPNYQSTLVKANYSHYSEAGRLEQQASWRSRIVFLTEFGWTMDAVSFIVNPSFFFVNVVDWIYLNTSRLYGSGTYGTSTQENFLQVDDAVLHVCHMDANSSLKSVVRGSIIYVSFPAAQNGTRWNMVPPGVNWIFPTLSADGYRLFYGYSSVFIAVLSTSVIVHGTDFNSSSSSQWARFYNVYGVDNYPAPLSMSLNYAIAVETASPYDFPGNTLMDRFNQFVSVYSAIPLPQRINTDDSAPQFRYVSAAKAIMTLKFFYNSAGQANVSTNGGPPTTLDYSKQWPFLSLNINDNSSGLPTNWISTVNGSVVVNVPDYQVPCGITYAPAVGNANWSYNDGVYAGNPPLNPPVCVYPTPAPSAAATTSVPTSTSTRLTTTSSVSSSAAATIGASVGAVLAILIVGVVIYVVVMRKRALSRTGGMKKATTTSYSIGHF
eukprot:TRINITY_DN10423_c0_g1_i4.p1 TRINITY_DN10423_c0_g1~~TRINITY_DN10423_c0_g1_i4.p1  ORF type:complete len:848 (-),score=171.71 TRINITY_DN10423_c0_g1_i4:60-2258(-)